MRYNPYSICEMNNVLNSILNLGTPFEHNYSTDTKSVVAMAVHSENAHTPGESTVWGQVLD